MRKILLLLALLLMVAGSAAADGVGDVHTLDHDELERSYILYVPEGDINGLVLALHPVASSGRAMEALTGFNAVADERGFVVAYPNSAGFYWDDGRSEFGLPPDNGTIDDIGFFNALIDEVSTEYGIEDVFITGMGNGGTMAYTAACTMPERLSGVAVVSALMWNYQIDYCPDGVATPVNMLIMHGAHDVIYMTGGNTFNNNANGGTWQITDAETTFNHWLTRNECNLDISQAYPQTTVTIYNECGAGTTTAFHTVRGGGNNWFRMGDNELNRFEVDATEVVAAFFTGDEDWQLLTTQPSAADYEDNPPRTHILYLPTDYDASEPLPLVLNLHGRTVNSASQAYTSGFNDIAENEGFIVLYPDGIGNEWNYVKDIPLYLPVPINDDAYLDMLLDDTIGELNVDTNRIYVTGLSNGGFMTQRLACTRHERFAAVASVAAAAPYGLTQLCDEDTPPIPFMLIQGTEDPINPWDGLTMENPHNGQQLYAVAPTENTIEFWLNHNHCTSGNFDRTDLPNTDPDSHVQVWDFTDCPPSGAVVLYGVIDGGHTWPGIHDFENAVVGEVNMDFNASQAIWDFFEQYSLEDRVQVAEVPTPEPNNDDLNFIINELQNGAYTIVYTVDLSASVTCSDDGSHLSDVVQAEVRAIADAFTALNFQVSHVTAVGDCRTAEISDILFGEPTTSFDTIDSTGLQLLMSRETSEGSLNLIIADVSLSSEATDMMIEAGQSVIIYPMSERGFQPLTVVPQDGWTRLLETNQAEN